MIPQDKKVVYVTRDIERALGMAPKDNYTIVSNVTPYGSRIKEQYPENIILIPCSGTDLKGTTDLLSHPDTAQVITPGTSLLVFKNTLRVEAATKTHGSELLNPPAALSERIENKLSQVRWLGPIGTKYLPPHASKLSKLITWKNSNPIVIQWAHGHTGDGTILVKNPDELRALQDKFPLRMARVSAYIQGPSYTVNAIVSKDRILMGNISYQITGLSPFTDNTFSTVGNDWGLAKKTLSTEDIRAIQTMVEEIGERMRADGWKGLFGVDIIKDQSRGTIYLIEINARQPASTTFESNLQEIARKGGSRGLTTFEAHIRSLLGLPIDEDVIRIEDGAQVIQRVTKNVQSFFDDVVKLLEKQGLDVVSYQNSAYNSDLLRIQSNKSIMDSHGTLNDTGRAIVESIKNSHFNIQI